MIFLNTFWAEAINIACYILNRVLIRSRLKKTPYKLWKGRKPNISYFHTFGCKYFVLNNGKENLGKFDAKSDEAIFIGYSLISKAYRAFNERTLKVEESIHVVFDESNHSLSRICNDVDDIDIINKMDELGIDDKVNKTKKSRNSNEEKSHVHQDGQKQQHEDLPKEWRFAKDHPKEQIIGDASKRVTTRSSTYLDIGNVAFVSQIKPKNVDDTLNDELWCVAMQEELNQFERNNV